MAEDDFEGYEDEIEDDDDFDGVYDVDIENPERRFAVTAGTENHEIEGREEAVAFAKKLSAEEGLRVNVERLDGMETMQFVNGSLETFVCETRERKGRARTGEPREHREPREPRMDRGDRGDRGDRY